MPNASTYKTKAEYNEYFRRYWSTRKKQRRAYLKKWRALTKRRKRSAL